MSNSPNTERYRSYASEKCASIVGDKKGASYRDGLFDELCRRDAQVRKHGLSDDGVIYDLLVNEHANPAEDYKNGKPLAPVAHLPSEMYDKMNYMCRKLMDRMAHFTLEYDFEIDERSFKTVLCCLFEQAPVLHSAFIDNHIFTRWRVEDYNIDDVVTVIHAQNSYGEAERFLTGCIPPDSNIQLRVALIYSNGGTLVAFYWNHMCMDGGGCKAFFDDLCRGYSDYVNNGKTPLTLHTGLRNYERVYEDFSPAMRKKAKGLLANITPHCKLVFPFTPASDTDAPVIIRREISAEDFSALRAVGKRMGASVNDLLSTAYIAAFYEVSGCPEKESVSISCAVDLRRYMKDTSTLGYTNHTTFMPVTVPYFDGDIAGLLKSVTDSTAKAKADPFMGLHGLPLLNIGYKTMVYAQAELVVKAFYRNAPLALSNVGVLNVEALALGGNAPKAAFVMGAVKNKPCAMMTALTLNGALTLSMCIRASEADRELLNRFFDKVEDAVKKLSNI